MMPSGGFQKRSNFAPSIWSFDSGYGTGDALDEKSTKNAAFYLQASTSTNSLEGRLGQQEDITLGFAITDYCVDDQFPPKTEAATIEPLTTQLNAFTTDDIFQNSYLPEFSSESDGCLTCEFWRITNPAENVRCEDCRTPGTAGPTILFTCDYKGRQVMPSADIPSASEPEGPAHTAMKRTRCTACELSALIDSSAPSSCPSCSVSSKLQIPTSKPKSGFKVKRSRAGRNSKLPLSALNRLQSWLDAHQDDPYPSAEEKRQLAQECGITEKQVTTWFTNARARQLNPLDTWLSSASEDELARESDIASAAQTPPYTSGFAYMSESRESGYRRAGSVSGSSAFSGSHPQPSRRGKKKNYRRTNQLPALPQIAQAPIQSPTDSVLDESGNQEMWQCTFCRRHLVPKSWRRHEETQHRPRAQWTCMLYGPRLPTQHGSGFTCAFCKLENPSEDHFMKNHRISECAKRPIGERTFFRPDHLRQHVKNFHSSTLFDAAQSRWKRGPKDGGLVEEGWTCGFCGEKLATWGIRETHIAGHFKEGMTMAQWRDYPTREQGMGQEVKSKEKRVDKEKEKEQDQGHMSGFARLSRTLTRRSTRRSQKSATFDDNATQTSSQHSSAFANAFESIPIAGSLSRKLTRRSTRSSHKSQPAESMTITHTDPTYQTPSNYTNAYDNSHSIPTTDPADASSMSVNPHNNSAFTTPIPMLPDINMDPLMSGYTSFVDWSQMSATRAVEPQYTSATDADLGLAFADPTLDNVDFGGAFQDGVWNPLDYQGPWGEGS